MSAPNPIAVPCPDCWAAAGAACKDLPPGSYHEARFDIASLEEESAPGSAPGKAAFERAAAATDLF